MAKTLYVETNFIMAIAKGQDVDAKSLLETVPHSIQIVIPSVCYMEALSSLATDLNSRNAFLEILKKQLNEVRRDEVEASAKILSNNLDRAWVDFGQWLNLIKERLYQALRDLSLHSAMIELDQNTINASLGTALMDKPQDNLILYTILGHARSSASGPKAFLSGDSDFGQPDVVKALDDVGVKHFPKTKNAIGWLQAQPDP